MFDVKVKAHMHTCFRSLDPGSGMSLGKLPVHVMQSMQLHLNMWLVLLTGPRYNLQ